MMQPFINFREQVNTGKLWFLHHKIFHFIRIQVASFPRFFNCLRCGAYKRSGIITHLLINIFIFKLFLSFFNITIPIPDKIRGNPYQDFFIKISLSFFKLQITHRSYLVSFLYLICRILMFIGFSSKLVKNNSSLLFLGLKVDFGLNLFGQTLFNYYENPI